MDTRLQFYIYDTRKGSSAHSQMHALVIIYNHVGYRSAWHMLAATTTLCRYLGSRTLHWASAFMTSCWSTLLNQSTIRYLSHCLSRKACEGKKPNSESTTSTGTISSQESSSLVIYRPLNCKCPLLPGFCIVHPKTLVFVSVANVMTDMHRNSLALTSNRQ